MGIARDGFRLSEYFYSNRIRLCGNMKSSEKHLLFRPIENHLCMVLDDFVLGVIRLFFEIDQMSF